jgi:hypothetical protein
MDLLSVTFVAVGIEVAQRGNFPFEMYDFPMAAVAFEFIVCYMVLVDKLGRVFYPENLRIIMAFHALVWRNLSVPLDDVEMAFSAGNPFFDVPSVIEGIPLDVYVTLGL